MLFLVTDSIVMQPNEQLSWSNTSLVLSLYLLFIAKNSSLQIDTSNDHENNLPLYLPHFIIELGAFRVSRGQGCFCFQGCRDLYGLPSLRDTQRAPSLHKHSHILAQSSGSQRFCFRTSGFYIGHQVATQHGAKIVYRTKVNVNVFSVFSTVSMQCQVSFCSFPISICHITK